MLTDFGEGSVAILHEMRLAVRRLMKRPLFTAFAAMSVAIGIGTSTAVSSLVDAVLFRPQPGVVEPHRMVNVLGPTGGWEPFSYPDFQSLRNEVSAFSNVAAFSMADFNVGDDAGGFREFGMYVSSDYFDAVGVLPSRGRFFLSEEDLGLGDQRVAVVSDQFWQAQLGGAPDVVGSTLDVNGESVQVVGVTPLSFNGHFFAIRSAIWMPLAQRQGPRLSREALTDRAERDVFVLARLTPEGSLAQAQAETDVLFTRLGEQFFESYGERGAGARIVQFSSLPQGTGGRRWISRIGVVLGALVGMVLLVTASNVAGMSLVRSAGQGRELALRMALGVGRARLVWYLLAETLVLFLLGGVGGVFLAWAGTRLLDLGTLPIPIPMDVDFSPNLAIIGSGLALALVTGCIFGIGPALWATRAGVTPLIKEGGVGPTRSRLRGAFVVGQTALSLVLVAAALLFLRSAQRFGERPLGFDPAGRYTVTVGLGLAWDGTDDEGAVLIRDLREHLEANPAFRDVALSSDLPLEGTGREWPHLREGTDQAEGDAAESVYRSIVSSSYFRAFGIPVIRGRGFQERDREGSPPVAVANQAYADRYGAGETVLGNRFRSSLEGELIEVVGIVANVSDGTLGGTDSPRVYIPLAQSFRRSVEVTVQEREEAEGTPGTLIRSLREANPGLSLAPVRGLEDMARMAILPQRILAVVSSGLALIGLLLSGLGLYGVVAFRVSSRRKEIGIRMALGAGQKLVRKEVLWDGLKLAMPGVLLGGLAAIAMARLLRFLLYGVGALDPVALIGVVVLGLVVVSLASYGPARKASAIDPGVALRLE